MNLNSNVSLSFLNKVSFLEKMLFTKHLAVMIKAGIPLVEAVEGIRDQAKDGKFRAVLSKVIKDLENGKSLESALSKHQGVFGPLYLSLVRIGEESGNLEANLEYLATQLKQQYEFRKMVQGAMLYPSVVLGTAIVIGGGISFFVLPQLVDLFSSLDADLPLSTKVLLWLAELMKNFGVYIFIGLITVIILFRIIIALPAVKKHWQIFLLKLPVIGGFLQGVQLSSMSRDIGIMLKSGLPISTVFETQIDATENLVYKDYLVKIASAINKGKSLEEELNHDSYALIPKIMVKMVGVGEKTGKLDESFTYLADFFEDDVNTTAKNFSNILEPIMLLVIGLVVAFVALSIISPIYELTGSVKR